LKNPKLPNPSKKTTTITFLLACLIATFGVGYALGSGQLYFTGGVPHLSTESAQQPGGVSLSNFWRVYNDATQNFDGTVNKQALINGATEGMVEALGDPYTEFFTASESQDFDNQLAGKVEGIGAEVGTKDGVITIIAPLDGSPAQKAGLKPGDQVVKIDGKSTDSTSLSDAVNKIRGNKGTKVTLTINRAGFAQPQDFTITRDVITVPSVTERLQQTGISYIQITQFGDDTSSAFKKAISQAASQHPKGIILDLRGNPGGFLTAAVDVASQFIPQGKVVVQEREHGKLQDQLTAESGGTFTSSSIPLAVLVDGGSASASEIVAGALQDYHRGWLIGQQTFGKGSVQDLINLPAGQSLKLTVAHWYTPAGHGINGKGLTPNQVVAPGSTGTDPQLDAAIQYLEQH
jgi:carboxyl-terminal processing protease